MLNLRYLLKPPSDSEEETDEEDDVVQAKPRRRQSSQRFQSSLAKKRSEKETIKSSLQTSRPGEKGIESPRRESSRLKERLNKTTESPLKVSSRPTETEEKTTESPRRTSSRLRKKLPWYLPDAGGARSVQQENLLKTTTQESQSKKISKINKTASLPIARSDELKSLSSPKLKQKSADSESQDGQLVVANQENALLQATTAKSLNKTNNFQSPPKSINSSMESKTLYENRSPQSPFERGYASSCASPASDISKNSGKRNIETVVLRSPFGGRKSLSQSIGRPTECSTPLSASPIAKFPFTSPVGQPPAAAISSPSPSESLNKKPISPAARSLIKDSAASETKEKRLGNSTTRANIFKTSNLIHRSPTHTEIEHFGKSPKHSSLNLKNHNSANKAKNKMADPIITPNKDNYIDRTEVVEPSSSPKQNITHNLGSRKNADNSIFESEESPLPNIQSEKSQSPKSLSPKVKSRKSMPAKSSSVKSPSPKSLSLNTQVIKSMSVKSPLEKSPLGKRPPVKSASAKSSSSNTQSITRRWSSLRQAQQVSEPEHEDEERISPTHIEQKKTDAEKDVIDSKTLNVLSAAKASVEKSVIDGTLQASTLDSFDSIKVNQTKINKEVNKSTATASRSKNLNKSKSKRNSKADETLSTLGNGGHPSCLELPEHIVPVVKGYDWQCNDCKFCFHCQNIENEEKSLFCDNCDRGYHMYCLQPKLRKKPRGDWYCPFCIEEQMEIEDTAVVEKKSTEEKKRKGNEPKTSEPEKPTSKKANVKSPEKVKSNKSDAISNKKESLTKNDTSPVKTSPVEKVKKETTVAKNELEQNDLPATTDTSKVQPVSEQKVEPEKDKKETKIDEKKQREEKENKQGEKKQEAPQICEPDNKCESSTSYRGTLREQNYNLENITSTDVEMFDHAKKKAQDMLEMDKESAPREEAIQSIRLGNVEMDAWYNSQYPLSYSKLSKLYICEFCFDYTKTETIYRRHMAKCTMRHPPGDEIYRKESLSIFEVDGQQAMKYCQNLCLMAKLFLDHKTLWMDVGPFLFYIMTINDERGCHIVGYFSKEKISFLNYNVSCILVMPHHMRKGYGKMLIDFSYLLSQREGKTGSPEKPLSDLGLMSYRNFWQEKLLNYLKDYDASDISIKGISEKMGIHPNDIVSTLQYLGMLKYWKGKHLIAVKKEVIDEYTSKTTSGSKRRREIDPHCLQWEAKVYK